MQARTTILTLLIILPSWLACGDSQAGDRAREVPAPTSVAAPPAHRAQPELAVASGLSNADVCSDVPQGHPSGRVHHFCDCGVGADPDCRPGSDTVSGTSTDPQRSYEAARSTFEGIAAGDTIAFCRGGSFLQERGNRWVNASCRAENRCVVRDYTPSWASGDEDAPIIRAREGSHAFALENGGRASHQEGYTFMNLDLRGRGKGYGFFVYNDMDDVDLCNVSIDGFKIGVSVSGSKEARPESDGKNDRIVLKRSRITNNSGQGWLGSCNGCTIEESYFENNGFDKPKFNHNIYISGSNKGVARGMRIVGNEVYRSAIVNGKCEGAPIVAHGEKAGLLIENNLVREDIGSAGRGCWGIAVDTAYSSAEAFTDVVIRNNRIINVGSVSIGVNSCSNCLIENNVIVQEQPFGGNHIAAPNRERAPDDHPMSKITIRNNSIYVGADSGGVGIKLGKEGHGHRVLSNAILYTGKNRWACFDLPLPSSSYDRVGHNVCGAPNSPSSDWILSKGSLEDWQKKTSHGAGSHRAAPGFTSVSPPYDLSAASARSAIVGAGDPAQSADVDIHGKKRGGTPDAGAFQH
jgi:hypothetical protein